MSHARHKRATARPRARRIVPLVLAAAVAASVPVGVAAWPDRADRNPDALHAIMVRGDLQRAAPLSRGLAERSPLPELSKPPTQEPTTQTPTPSDTPTPEPTVTGHMYATADLNVRTEPAKDAKVLTVLARGTKVGVSGTTNDYWVQIIHDDTPAWVSGDFLSKTKPPKQTSPPPATATSGGISYAECASGSAVEAGLTPDAIRVHRAVCAEFPAVTSYGGTRSGGGEHSTGRALDIMVSSSSLGDAISAWVREHHSALGVSEVIWSQRIWTVERSSEGWRWMEDRGSATANHYDHVHVTVYGNSGG